MKPAHHTWINQILNSLDSLNSPEPSPFLYAKIRNQLTTNRSADYVPTRLVWIAGASFMLLVLLNWQLLVGVTGQRRSVGNELDTVIQDMQLYPTTNQLYDVWSGQNY